MASSKSLTQRPSGYHGQQKSETSVRSNASRLGALILAGGGSQRFGNDKALYEIDGNP